MDPDRPLLISLDAPEALDERIVGGKAAKLARLSHAGFRVPRGFCLTTWAYEAFVEAAKITAAIAMELGRKSMDDMRWEEIWDAALRIRATFLAQPLSDPLRDCLAEALSGFDPSTPLAVRSSAIGEDSAGCSFAGLHESIIGVRGRRALEDAVRLVWASLWSDAALLYRVELALDPAQSRMAVLVQEMVDADRSGVAFARDPRDPRKERAIIESVPGPCSLLVDGTVDPDRWEIDRETSRVITWLPGQREEGDGAPLLEPRDLEVILENLLSIERLFSWPPDMEWTGRSASLTLLQARPITTAPPDTDEQRNWYLTLRPGDARLQQLRERVVGRLIPELEAEGEALAAEKLDQFDDRQLADALEQRSETVAKWKQIYWDEFIPFGHGVRRLAIYYNDAVQPEDPYEFVGLLRGQPLLAAQRNRAIGELAQQLAADDALRNTVEEVLESHPGALQWADVRTALLGAAAGAEAFVHGFEALVERFLDIAYDHQRLHDQAESLLRNLIELSRRTDSLEGAGAGSVDVAALEQRVLAAVGPERHAEAMDIIETGRVSWRLRDDDNLLVSRLESQLLRAIELAASRLRERGTLTGSGQPRREHSGLLARALRAEAADPIVFEVSDQPLDSEPLARSSGETPRQLIGQPASPGVGTGLVRRIRGHDDLARFRSGEVIVCDAIQPTMTHLVPLAAAIVERRGGMLIHGAIIARELGIPCVNGVRDAADLLEDGDFVTVDGHLGIVAVGAPEFDLELSFESASSQ